jgi:ribosomal protein S18 acetylase RimI-like enzyme
MTSIGLRPATARDSEFCFRLHKAALGDAVAAIWGWDEDVQRDFHDRVFAPGRWQIITADGTDAGMLHVEHRSTETCLARIELHPDHQGRGIGSGLVRMLLREAEQRDQALVLDVLAVNERAQALYPATRPERGGLARRRRRQGPDVQQVGRRLGSARSGRRRLTVALWPSLRPVGGEGDEGPVGHS